MSLTEAERALVVELETLFPDAAIEYENQPVSVSPGQQWIQVFGLGAKPDVATLGDAGEDRADSVLQLTLHYPVGTGKADYGADYEAVRRRFPAGKSFAFSGQSVQIKSVDKATGRIGAKDYVGFVSINWFAFIPR
jgi:hypothetical protein